MSNYQREMLIRFNGGYICIINGQKVICRGGIIIWLEREKENE